MENKTVDNEKLFAILSKCFFWQGSQSEKLDYIKSCDLSEQESNFMQFISDSIHKAFSGGDRGAPPTPNYPPGANHVGGIAIVGESSERELYPGHNTAREFTVTPPSNRMPGDVLNITLTNGKASVVIPKTHPAHPDYYEDVKVTLRPISALKDAYNQLDEVYKKKSE